MSMASRTILVIDDCIDDITATKRAFKKAGLRNPIRHCVDGEDALRYFGREGEYSNPDDSPVPSLVLLDLNMPGVDGHQVLAHIRNTPELKSIPVVVLTTSDDGIDVEKCYEHGANSYIQKPVDFLGLAQAIQRLRDYWFELVVLPRNS